MSRGWRVLCYSVLVVGLALDQLTKLWILHRTDLSSGGMINILPGVDFVLSWNRGISYGLFQQDSEFGRWALAGFTLLATAFLSIWMQRTESRIVSLGLALIIGGAVGNLIDRLAYGAVVDFVYLHYGSFSWYVFNLADSWIVAGAALVLYDSFRPGHQDAAKRQDND